MLVVEDDQEMAEATALGLRRQSKAVDVTVDGPSGFEHTVTNDDDVIVLDRDLPGRHGDDICTQLVAAGCRSRVLMPTAAATIDDLVDGLGLGAHDYLPEPFDFKITMSRLRTKLGDPPVIDTAAKSGSRI